MEDGPTEPVTDNWNDFLSESEDDMKTSRAASEVDHGMQVQKTRGVKKQKQSR